MHYKKIVVFGVALILVVMLSGCTWIPTGNLRLMLTDPTDTDLMSVFVNITSIEVIKVSDPDNPITVFKGSLIVDLLGVQFPNIKDLGEVELEEGYYNEFKILISKAWAIDKDGNNFECNVPPNKFNVAVVDNDTKENSFFTIIGDTNTTVIIDIEWNEYMANNPGQRNLNPTGKAFIQTT